MKLIKSILAAGGDARQLYCAERLAAHFDISVTGFSESAFPEGMSLKRLSAAGKSPFDCVILPIPALDGEGFVNTPLSQEKLPLETIRGLLAPGGIVFAGRVTEELRRAFPENPVIDYSAREELCLRNAVPTAEGAVQIALSELPVTLCGLPVLIIGLGRIGTALAGILRGFGAQVTAAVRSPVGRAKAAAMGIPAVSCGELPTDFGLVVNTAPELVLDREKLGNFGTSTLFIDLASKPGGIDMEAAAELGLKVIWALGLPGRCAPVTAGYIAADTIAGIIEERGEA